MSKGKLKICLLLPNGVITKKKRPFSLTFDNIYAQRFLKHLRNDPNLCTGCGSRCVHCRNRYNLDFSSQIAGVFEIPSVLSYFVDNPEKYFPERFPSHEVMVAINIHEDILLALPEKIKERGAKALIVPIEAPKWITRWGRERLKRICSQLNLEVAFPKPFCSLRKGNYRVINDFIEDFRIGFPKLKFEIRKGVIKKAKVLRSAPCGDTYFVAFNLPGTKVEEIERVVAKYWHSYPCVASMKMDEELGDTILHKGGYIHYEAVHKGVNEALNEDKDLTEGEN